MKRDRVLGGQAVLEGVMMRGGNRVAVAVRRPDSSIHVEVSRRSSWSDRYPVLRCPLLRGAVVLCESLIVGMEALQESANEAEDEEKTTRREVMGSLLLSLTLAAGLFVLTPLLLAMWWLDGAQGALFALVEGSVRLGLFLLYIALLAKMKDIRRVFQYHGAEHKAINCYEAGDPLTVEGVRRHSLLHKRCGTAFLLYVMLFATLLFAWVSPDKMAWWQLACVRFLLMPAAIGLAYEAVYWSGRFDHKLVDVLAAPGLLLQRMTTREPDDEMIEVAIASVEAVLEMKATAKIEEVNVS